MPLLDLCIVLNEDDEKKRDYLDQWPVVTWKLMMAPQGSRPGDIWRIISKHHADDEFFGILSDDMWPETPEWWRLMQEAAGSRYIALANDKWQFPKLRNIVCIGGELVRAMGSLAPCDLNHNYIDNVWEKTANDFGLLKPLSNVVIRHRHWLNDPSVSQDETYRRGAANIKDDGERYKKWAFSDERREASERIAKMLGGSVRSVDLSKFNLAICVPMHDCKPDISFQTSWDKTTRMLSHYRVAHSFIPGIGGSHIGKARERLLWQAMATPATHILFIDSDMGWEPETVLDLLASEVEFASVVGVRKEDTQNFCFNTLSPNPTWHQNLMEVRDVGFGMVMLRRLAIDKMCAAYPELQYRTGDGSKQYALFLDMLDGGDGIEFAERLSEDFSFCRRWRAIGGKIWINPYAALTHAGRKEYTGRVSDIFEFNAPVVQAAE